MIFYHTGGGATREEGGVWEEEGGDWQINEEPWDSGKSCLF